ncbi:MAG: hypothetical protein H0V19_05095 [Euzebyales bacterium]|nr:hypothetical protein [Euzebyales bacterium]MBA3620721.1 hypothetical protein [Euzebyales bacterium]
MTDDTPVPIDPSDASQLVAEVGEPSSPDGRTRVTLHRDGRLVVQWERSAPQDPKQGRERERREEAGELGQDPQAVFERASRFLWDQDFPTRPGLPDEAILVWQLGGADDRRTATVKVWLEDAEGDPSMAPVLQALREGTARLTGGDVYL